MDAAAELEQETEKWHEKLRVRMKQVAATDEAGEDLLENAQAYHDDADHFRAEGDLVRAFESVVWAWSWIEIGERLGHLETEG